MKDSSNDFSKSFRLPKEVNPTLTQHNEKRSGKNVKAGLSGT